MPTTKEPMRAKEPVLSGKGTTAFYLPFGLLDRVDAWRERQGREEGATVSRSAAVARLLHRALTVDGIPAAADEHAP